MNLKCSDSNCPPLGEVVDYLEYGVINVVLTIQVC